MSGPASSYSYSEYTVAPSEASLNARWYNQIQQWTNRLPSRSPNSSSPGYATNSVARDDANTRRRDVDEGTEGGTVLPMHSVSRRASMAERRKGIEQMAEPKVIAPTDGKDAMESRPSTGHRGWTLDSHAGTTVNQPAPSLSYRRSSPTHDDNAVQRVSTLRILRSTAGKTDAVMRDSATRLERIAVHAEPDKPHRERCSTPGDKPTRGRRPPTPYHPPSDFALRKIPESVVGDEREPLHREVRVIPITESKMWLIIFMTLLRGRNVDPK